MTVKVKYDDSLTKNLKRLGLITLGSVISALPALNNRIQDDLARRLVNDAEPVRAYRTNPSINLHDYFLGEDVRHSERLWNHYRDWVIRNNPNPSDSILILPDLDGDKKPRAYNQESYDSLKGKIQQC